MDCLKVEINPQKSVASLIKLPKGPSSEVKRGPSLCRRSG